jgi:Tfp pilus assembly protein PilN
MNQTINFYTEILRIRNIPLSFHVMKNFVYGLCLFMLISTVILGIIQLKNEKDLKDLEKQQLNTFSKLQSQESKVTSKTNRDQIIAQLEINDKLYEKNKEVLEELDQVFKSGSEGFSKYLISLSKSIPRGLWLTKIELLDSGKRFSLSGKALEAKLVTAFISSLNKEPAFKGKVLNIFDIVYNKTDSVLEFRIQTGTENSS